MIRKCWLYVPLLVVLGACTSVISGIDQSDNPKVDPADQYTNNNPFGFSTRLISAIMRRVVASSK